MYKSLKREDFLKMFGLPDDYSVDGCLFVGAGVPAKKIRYRDQALEELGINFKIEEIDYSFLHSLEVLVIEGKRYWFEVIYGGAKLSELLHFGCILGSKKNILVGTCGGLSTEMEAGDFVIPEYSHGNESTTRMYDRENKKNIHYPDKALSKELMEQIPDRYKVFNKPTVTCQAMVAETMDDIKQWGKDGYYAVEMESSTFFSVSKHFKVPAAAILTVTDNLVKNEYVGSDEYLEKKKKRRINKIDKYKTAIKVLIKD